MILHDPQTAGLIPAVKAAGVPVVWRCHIGVDVPNDIARGAWRFLERYVREADAVVFSREAFEWEGLDGVPLHIIAPSIDAFSPKNQDLPADAVAAILRARRARRGQRGRRRSSCAWTGPRAASSAAPRSGARRRSPDGARYLLQVSRWDR